MSYFIRITIIGLLCLSANSYGAWQDLWFRKDQQAMHLLQKGKAEEAAKLFESKDWQAVANYKSKNYPQAESIYQQNNTPTSHYNLGNALALQGKYEEAIAAYDAALQKQPNMPDAVYNRDLVKKLLEQEKQQQKKDKDKQQDKNQKQDKDNKQKDNKKDDKDKKDQKDKQDDKSKDNKKDNKDQDKPSPNNPSKDQEDKKPEQPSQDNGDNKGNNQGNNQGNAKNKPKDDPFGQNDSKSNKDQQKPGDKPGDNKEQQQQSPAKPGNDQNGQQPNQPPPQNNGSNQPGQQQPESKGNQKPEQPPSEAAADQLADKNKNQQQGKQENSNSMLNDSPIDQTSKSKEQQAKEGGYAAKKKQLDEDTDQWLQQIPDDPGGLLRRKIMRDHLKKMNQGEED